MTDRAGPQFGDRAGDPAEGILPAALGGLEERLEHGLDAVRDVTAEIREAIKPRLRGWLHAGTFPVSVAAGAVLVILSPDASTRLVTAVFALTASLLFGVSAIYHTGRWSEPVKRRLKRFDHANIFLIIAGTYTPFSVLLLPPGPARVLLWIVWSGALAGVAFRVFWVGAPRWLYVPVYVVLGWVAVGYLPDLWHRSNPAEFTLLVVGGALYTLGGLVYGLKKPDPSPRWFGFHEVFHALTVAAFVSHYVGLSLVVYSSTTG